jgi:hypothetical protein
MSVGTLARWSIVPFFLIMLVYHVRQLRRSRSAASWYSAALLSVPVVLILVAAAAALVEPPTLLSVLLTIFTTQQGLLIAYFGIEQVNTNSVPSRIFLRRRRYLVGTLLIGGVLVLTWLRRDNLGSFIDDDPYQPTRRYYGAYAADFALRLAFSLQIVQLTWHDVQTREVSLMYRVRNYLTAVSFVIAALSALVVELNLLLSVTIGDVARQSLNVLYHALKPVVASMLVISSAPTQFLQRPIQYLLDRRRAQQDRDLTYLHAKVLQIVPTVHLDVAGLDPAMLGVERDDQLINEISDARELIYSQHVPQEMLQPPADEAALIHTLLRDHTTIDKAGPYTQPIDQGDLLGHTLAVARQLRRLERR